MRHRSIFATICVLLAFSGCKTSKDEQTHVTLIQLSADKSLLAIAKPERVGIIGPDGYVGWRTAGYWAALQGPGPVYDNPHFQDDSSDLPCIGRITLDRGHNEVTIDMKRVVSKSGGMEQTKPHPANGTYVIEQTRTARPGEAWF